MTENRTSEARVTRVGLILLVFLLLVGGVLRFTGITWGLPNDHHRYSTRVDESTYLLQLREMNPLQLDFVSESYPFRIPPLPAYTYGGALAVGAVLGAVPLTVDEEIFREHPEFLTRLYLIPRLVTAFLGTMTILLVFLLGRALFDERTALLGAGFLAVCPVHVEYSHFLLADVMTGFWMTFAVVGAWFWVSRKRVRWGVLTGILLALSLSAKHSAWPILVLLPLIFWFLKNGLGFKIALRQTGLAVGTLILFYLLLNPVLVLSPSVLVEDFLRARETTAPALGGTGVALNWFKEGMLPIAFSWPVIFLIAVGFMAACRFSRRRELVLLAVPCACWFLFFSVLRLERVQVFAAWAPLLLLMAAGGTMTMIRFFRDRHGEEGDAGRPLYPVLVIVLVIALAMTAWQSGAIASHLSQKSVHEEAREWIESGVIAAGSRIGIVNWTTIPQIDTERFVVVPLGLDFSVEETQNIDYFIVSEFDEPLVQDRLGDFEIWKTWEPRPTFLGLSYTAPYSDMKITLPRIRLYARKVTDDLFLGERNHFES